jgi:hypothetical protein
VCRLYIRGDLKRLFSHIADRVYCCVYRHHNRLFWPLLFVEMKSPLLIAAASAVAAQTVPTVHIPLNAKFGYNEKTSTNLYNPSTNTTIEVVFDTGSENFFLFGPGAIANWGSSSLGTEGPCNASVPAGSYFDYPQSSTATAPVNHSALYVYGGADKIYDGYVTVNDTFGWENAAGVVGTDVDARLEIVDFLVQRINDPTCAQADELVYDLGIIGVSPYYNSSSRVTAGPSIRQDLLDGGVISTAVQSIWFDQAPADVFGTYTGGALLGGIDTSKYTGDLVKVQTAPQAGQAGYFTVMPNVTINGVSFSQPDSTTYCQLDTGTHDDTIPINYTEDDAFYNATGIVITPIGYTAWPGACESIPANNTIDLTFPGATDGTSVTIQIPLRAYVRTDDGTQEEGYCMLDVSTSGCLLGVPFATASFFAADDELGEIAIAKGAVAEKGAPVDQASVVARIP